MEFTNLNYWFNSLQACLTINGLLEVTSTQEETINYFEREGRDAILYILISHEIPAEQQYKRFKEELEENITFLINNDLRAKKLITLLHNKLEKLQELTDNFFEKICSAYSISKEELNRKDQWTAFEYLADDIRMAAFTENEDRDPTQQELLELRNDLIYYLFVAVQHTARFLSDYLIIYDQESANSAGQESNPLAVKLEWNCNPAEVGFIIAELVKHGYINAPTYKGQISYSKLGKLCHQLFTVTINGNKTSSTPDHWENQVNQGRNALPDHKRAKLNCLPDLSDLN